MEGARAAASPAREAAFVLAADGGIRRVEVPRDAGGRALALGTVGWRVFVGDALNVAFTVGGREVPVPAAAEWGAEDHLRLPAKSWDLSGLGGEGGAGGAGPLVKVFVCPYENWEHWHEELEFNRSAPLFTDSEYWRGDMLLVCCRGGAGGRVPTIVSPAALLAGVPGALRDFWHVDFEVYRALLLAFAMLTHRRLGARARGRGLDEELVRMVLEEAFPDARRLRLHASPEAAWELRGVFHAMAQTEYAGSSEEESGESGAESGAESGESGADDA